STRPPAQTGFHGVPPNSTTGTPLAVTSRRAPASSPSVGPRTRTRSSSRASRTAAASSGAGGPDANDPGAGGPDASDPGANDVSTASTARPWAASAPSATAAAHAPGGCRQYTRRTPAASAPASRS